MTGDEYAHTLARLYRLEARAGIDLGLERVQDATKALGCPERAAPAIHVAGTNGKGSTAVMLAAMLRAAGKRVGLFTSPHLVSFRERIVVDEVPISEREVIEGMTAIEGVLGRDHGLTCFELITLLAWRTFAAHDVDVSVLEVGLGGRLDATNVVRPEVAVITNVGRDHEQYLGHDIATIAAEKAGIIKPGVPIVSGASGEAADVIATRARALGSPLSLLGRDFSLAPDAGGGLAYRSARQRIAPLALALRGAFQRRNAAVAIRALELVATLMPEASAIRAGLARSRWRGRLQVVSRRPLVLLDGAHNPAGIEVLVDELRTVAAGRSVRVLFGVMRDKAWEGMLATIRGLAAEIVLTRPNQSRAADPATLASVAGAAARVEPDPVTAYRALVAASDPDDVVVVTGSLFLVADVLPIIDPALAAEAERERAANQLAGRV